MGPTFLQKDCAKHFYMRLVPLLHYSIYMNFYPTESTLIWRVTIIGKRTEKKKNISHLSISPKWRDCIQMFLLEYDMVDREWVIHVKHILGISKSLHIKIDDFTYDWSPNFLCSHQEEIVVEFCHHRRDQQCTCGWAVVEEVKLVSCSNTTKEQ